MRHNLLVSGLAGRPQDIEQWRGRLIIHRGIAALFEF